MPRNYLIIAALVFLLLAPVAADILPSAKKLQKQFRAEVLAEQSDTFKAMKEHVHEMKEELKDSLREKGAAFKTGAKEGEADQKKGDLQDHMPGLDNLNQEAHNAGYAAGAAKEKAAQTGEKLKEGLSNAADSLKDKTKDAADTLKGAAGSVKEKLQDLTDSAKDAAADTQKSFNKAMDQAKDAAESAKDSAKDKLESAKDTVKEKLETAKDVVKEKLADAAESAQKSVEQTKEVVKEKVRGAVDSAKEGAQYAGEKLKAGAESLKEEAEDAIGHAAFAAKKAEAATEERLRNLKDEVKEESEHVKNGLQLGAEELSKKGANLRDEVKLEAEHVRGIWNWLSGWVGDTKDKVHTEWKKEEAITKAKIAQRTYEAAVEREAAANRALAEYEALKAKVYGAKHAAGEVKDAVYDLGTKVKGVADDAKDKIKDAATRVKDTAEDVTDKLKDRLHHLTELEQIGTAKPDCNYKADDGSHIHSHEYNPEHEQMLREELRLAKEEREHVTSLHEPMPMHGKSVGDRLRGWFAV